MPVVADKYRGSKAYHLVYAELIRAAQHRGLVTCQEVAKIMGLPLSGNHMQREVGQMAGEIAEDEHINGRPMLSAIVVNKQGQAGTGFFNLARSLGKLQSSAPEDEAAFWEREKAAAYAAWQPDLT